VAATAALGTPAQGDCAFGVEYRGAFYPGATPVKGEAIEQGRPLDGGRYPGCDDFIVVGPDGKRQNEPPPSTPADLVRVEGVRAAIAVAVRDDPGAFLAPGYLAGVRSHPLHTAFYAKPSRRPCARGARVTRSGTLPFQPGFGKRLVLERGSRETDLEVEPSTRIRGVRTRAGLPYFDRGDRLRVTGRRCSANRLVAEVIRRG